MSPEEGSEGLFETMLARDGQVPWLDRHLERMAASAASLGLRPFPDAPTLERAVRDAVAQAGGGRLRVRLGNADALAQTRHAFVGDAGHLASSPARTVGYLQGPGNARDSITGRVPG